jgi:hypothetical protein
MPPTTSSTLNTTTGNWVSTSDHRRLFQAPSEEPLAVVLINNCVHHIITTTTIKGVSNGGHIAIYPHRTPTSSASWKSTPQIQMQILQFSKESVPASSQTFLSKVLHVQQFEPAPAQHQFPLHPQSFNLSQCLHRHLFQLLDPYCSFVPLAK